MESGAGLDQVVRLHRWERGSADAEHVLLLVAGTGYSGSTWPEAFLRELEPDVRLIMFDHRGTGETPGTDCGYSTRLFARDAIALIKELQVVPHVLGHSMGGRVAQWMAIEEPQALRSLILVASGSGETRIGQSRGIPPATVVGLMKSGYEGYVRELQRRTFFTSKFVAESPDVVGGLGEAFWQSRPTLESYLKHVEARQSHSAAALLSDVSSPAVILVGSEDVHEGATGSHFAQSVALHEALRDSQFSQIMGASHGVFWERPVETANAIRDWINQGAVDPSY